MKSYQEILWTLIFLVFFLSCNEERFSIEGNWCLRDTKARGDISELYQEMYINDNTITIFGGPFEQIILETEYNFEDGKLMITDRNNFEQMASLVNLKRSSLTIKIKEININATYVRCNHEYSLSKYLNDSVDKKKFKKEFFFRKKALRSL